ncbi:MAG: RnfABCDGE type electron transport complex subunit G [Lachnospiraceae bacterium]|nr:RnfABCDGE type electron transport complex subunit G [Lachnospiraceae bacterium]
MEEKKSNDNVKVMIKEAIILTVITLLSGLLLGYVHELTKDPIRVQEELAIQNACKAVFSNVSDVTFLQIDYQPSTELQESLARQGVTIGKVYNAMDAEGIPIGYVIESTSSEGYGGNIVLYVGVTNEGVLNAVSILSISETPGLGMRAQEVLIPQLQNKNAVQITYTKNGASQEDEIDAISGATITTKAVTAAVNGALKIAMEMRGGEDVE